jgi:hypothetical protein
MKLRYVLLLLLLLTTTLGSVSSAGPIGNCKDHPNWWNCR